MQEPERHSTGTTTRVPPAVPEPDQLEEVRNLLFGAEQRKLTNLTERLDNPFLRAQDVSRVLPHAVVLSAAKDDQLARALTPAMERALHASVKRSPAVVADALFPVIGPAIRKAIAETLHRLLQAVNQAVEHSFTPRGLRWRWEAWRTGRTFAEVVLRHTLIYRVEQVLLIHRQTGLLLHHVCAPNILVEDGEQVSSMLTAIQHFMKDCFRVDQEDTVRGLQVGELTVWLETAPHVMLAAVIRGSPPQELRLVMQNSVESIVRELGPVLASFEGDSAPFVTADPVMAACLVAQLEPTASGGSRWKTLVLAVLVFLGLGLWGWAHLRESRRWVSLLRRLEQEPGILVTASGKQAAKYYVAGFRDPLAVDLSVLAQEYHLDANRIIGRWEPYQSLAPAFLLRRVGERLRPPKSVALRLEGGVLYAVGTASNSWIESARRSAEALPGIEEFNTTRLFDQSLNALELTQQEVEGTVLYFDETTRLTAGQEAALANLVAEIRELVKTAAEQHRRVMVNVLGHTDKKGTLEYNQWLSRQRAEQTIGLLAARGISPAIFVPAGLGTNQPLRADLPASDEWLNRRVTFRVSLAPAQPGP